MKKNHFDFTIGSIPKTMILFALPTFAANALQSSYQFIDSLWVGNLLGADALGAVSLSSPIIFTILSFIIGMNSATLTVLSQAKGRQDEIGLKRSLNAFVVVLGLLTIALGFLGWYLSPAIVRMLGAPEALVAPAVVYLRINFIGIAFLFGYNFIGTVLRALGNSHTPLRIVLLAVVLNTVLDPIFIAVFDLGIAGAAYATVISQGIAFVYGIVYSLRNRTIPFSVPHLPDRRYTRQVLQLGFPGGLQMVAVSSGLVVIMSIVASFGETVVAGFGAAQRIESIIMLPAMTLGSVVNTMAGQNIGAGKWDRVRTIAYSSTIGIIALSLLLGALCFVAAKPLVRLFVDDPETIRFGTTYLRSVAFFYTFLGINFVLNGVARSSGAMFQVLILNIISFWVLRFPLTALFASLFGSDGIAYGIAASFVVSSFISAAYYVSGHWRKSKVLIETKKSPT